MNEAYAAGLFDGEGSVLIYKRTTSLSPRGSTTPYQIRATVTNTNRAVIDALKAHFGGCVAHDRPVPGARRREAWKWSVQCQAAASFFRVIRPFTLIKSAEIDLALEMQARINGSRARTRPGRRGQPPLPPDEIASRDAIWARLQDTRRAPY